MGLIRQGFGQHVVKSANILNDTVHYSASAACFQLKYVCDLVLYGRCVEVGVIFAAVSKVATSAMAVLHKVLSVCPELPTSSEVEPPGEPIRTTHSAAVP